MFLSTLKNTLQGSLSSLVADIAGDDFPSYIDKRPLSCLSSGASLSTAPSTP